MHIKTSFLITLTLFLVSCNDARKSELSFDEIYPEGESFTVSLDRKYIRQNAYNVQFSEFWALSANIVTLPLQVIVAPFYHANGVRVFITFDKNEDNPWQEIHWGDNTVRRPKTAEGANMFYLLVEGTYRGYQQRPFTEVDKLELFGDPTAKNLGHPNGYQETDQIRRSSSWSRFKKIHYLDHTIKHRIKTKSQHRYHREHHVFKESPTKTLQVK